LFKKNLISFLAFLFVWCLFGIAIGIFRHFNEPPMGVHQSAQCDRASLAQNYYYNGFKFLYPEVNENRCTDGIVSCEFPFTNYLAACLYKVFGYDEFWFRLLSYVLISLGMYALFLLFRLFLHSIVSFLLVLLINTSPVILFYSANFLPDISSMGLMLVAWFLFFRMHVPHTYQPALKSIYWQLLMILCIGIGVASKTTSLIQWLTMFAMLVLSGVRWLKIAIIHKKELLITLACSLIIPIAWFLWSRHLSQTHNSQYFMMHIPLSGSLESYKSAWAVYLANWPPQTFSEPLIYAVVFLFFAVIALKKFISPNLWFLSVINFIGSAAFLCIMMEQFKYHDYYIICLFPSFALCWIALADASKAIKPKFWWIKFSFFILVCLAFRHQFRMGMTNLEERYTPGNYWEQSHVNSKDYEAFKLQLQALGIDRSQCVVAGNDNAPNNILYLLNLRGHRFSKDHDNERIQHIISGSRPRYLISNDSAFTEKVRPIVGDLKLKTSYKYMRAYEIMY
jgi:hypothetical protein